jgi:hypothetical protein
MLRPALCLLTAVLSPALALTAQTPAVPALAATPQMRFVDFSKDLDRPGIAVVVGRLGKCKEGKRERLADGKLGGAGSVSQVSGTQYFKVPVQASIAAKTTLVGKPDKLQLTFDMQLARLPDGKEQRQSMTGNGAPLEEDMLALWVVAPRAKGKGLELLHVIPFDKNVDKGPDAELQFGDAMADYYTVNRRAHDLRAALEATDKAADPESRKKQLAALRELKDQKVELHHSENDALLTQHVGPLEARAQKRLAEEAVEAAEAAKEKSGDDK